MTRLEKRGFIKYELVIATLFVAVMTAFMVFVMSKKLEGARVAACRRNVKMIERQLKVWYAEKGTYPESPVELERFMREFFPGGLICPVTGSSQSYTIDLATHQVHCEHWDMAKPR